MASVDSLEKDKAMDLAEDSREAEWKHASFVAELFRGNFRWDLIYPFPLQDPEDQRIGDEMIEKVRPVLEHYINPSEVDRTGHLPQEAVDALAAIGVFGMKIPTEYGGLGFSQTNYSRVCAFIGTYCSSTVSWVSAHQSIGAPQPLRLFGTEEQKQKYLPRLAKGAISAFALTEPGVGSDPARMATTATPSDDGSYYLLNGEKLWCTNGTRAELIVVMAKTPSVTHDGKERQQISAFIVETDSPGFEVAHQCSFMGCRAIANGLLRFNNVKVPAENIIGKPGQGLKIALTTLNAGRLVIPAGAAGGGKAAIHHAQKWCKERVQWGQPIGKHQSVAKKLANLTADTFAMESITWLTCGMYDRGGFDIRLEAAMAKYYCTETGWNLVDDFVQIRGGRGYETAESLAARGEEPIAAERMMRNARIARIVEGSSEIMQLIIAREAMDTHLQFILPMMKAGSKVEKKAIRKKMARFYLAWYPKLWLPASAPSTAQLNAANQDHLAFIAKTSKRLARSLFHTMAKHRQKLENEQLLLANYVDIGTDLFAMAASLAHAESLLRHHSDNQSVQPLVDLFCRNARKRIEQNFRDTKNNHNRLFTKVANKVLDQEYAWMVEGVYTESPPVGEHMFARQEHTARE
jgi:alkylation response protein AidB-like acyl-CoA dehydrogenase